MDSWQTSLKNFWMALRRYLNQPLLDQSKTTILDPWKFDRYNNIQFLGDCWELHYSSKETHS